jgi:F-type H+-transporting ATPase subunit b
MADPHSTDYSLLGDTNVWLGASFLIFLFILWKMGKDAFIKMVDTKIAGIRNEISTAESLRIESQELLAQYERKHRDAVQDAELIIKNAQKHAHQIKKDAEQELEETMARREKQLAERLERMKQNAITEIQQHAANLAIQATKEIIIDKMDDKVSDRLIEQSIKDVSGQVH